MTTGWIALHVPSPVGTYRASIDGVRVNLTSRATEVAVGHGLRRVRVWYIHFGATYGEREMDVHVRPGAPTRVFYTAPRHVFGRASLGLEFQQPSWKVDRQEVQSSCMALVGFGGLILVLLLIAGVVVALWRALLG